MTLEPHFHIPAGFQLNPIPRVVWNYVNPCGGAIMAQMDSSHSETVSRHSRAQNWSPSNSFDLWLSKDTKNSTLWTVVLTMLAVKRQRRKMKFYMQKSQNLKYLDTLELYTSKERLQHVQCKFKKKKYDYSKKDNVLKDLM